MGKYYGYGQQLDTAFKAARDQYVEALEELQSAQREYDDSRKWHPDEGSEARSLREAKAKIALYEAQQSFDAKAPDIWATFNQTRAELRQGLEKEVRAANTADPDAIDANAVKLMESGIMNAEDFKRMAEKYDGNPTMTRMIAKYARDAAGTSDNARERAALNALAIDCASGLGSVMTAWDSLSRTADYCSGQAHEGRNSSPDLITNMAARWEELTAEAIESL